MDEERSFRRGLNSAFIFREITHDLRQIARYVVEGSMRATARQVRVTIQLINATSGEQVWAKNFNRTIDAHFWTQAAVARVIDSCLSLQIERAEADRIRIQTSNDLTTHGLVR